MCPNCGAAVAPDAVRCGYCNVQLQTIACPSCLGMIFRGAKHCSHCGARTFSDETADGGGEAPSTDAQPFKGAHACPRCHPAPLTVSAIGSAILEECGACGGVWVDAQSFEEICQSREEQAAYVGAGSPVPVPSLGVAAPHEAVQYVKCPLCGQIMNRVNFARHSGVIVDVCKGHGTWFDRDELRRIVEFIRGGGLDVAREKEREELEIERERLKERERAAPPVVFRLDDDSGYHDVIGAARDLLRWLKR